MITPNLQSKKLQELMREKRSVITCFFLTPKTLNLTPKYKQVLRDYEEKKSVVICLILTSLHEPYLCTRSTSKPKNSCKP